jgi:hypothetical protein
LRIGIIFWENPDGLAQNELRANQPGKRKE